MLQEFLPDGRPKERLGAGASVSFMCEDATALYREFRSRGVQTRNSPSIGNGLWAVPLIDPDGYRIEFASPTDAPEEPS
jgi:lactoylglutathione lyase